MDATVALFSGNTMLTDSSPSTAVNDVQAWIVVIKQVPDQVGDEFNPDNPNGPLHEIASQANVAVDASTGKILYAVVNAQYTIPSTNQ